MPLNFQTTRQHLQDFDFRKLFNELGWNNPPHALQPADAEAKGGLRFHRVPVAELSGITVFAITTTEGATPEPNDCSAIHAAVTKIAAENILIFTDKARTQCLLYWVKREAGKSFRRPHRYIKGQPGDLFISKLDALRVDISELDKDGNLAPGEGNRRVKRALDVERVTKNFYDQFQKEHAAFLKSFADCIPVKGDAEWYASVMLNRLMFVYFIQHKGFLDNDRDYLRTRLDLMRQQQGEDKFHSFYRYFLIKLFHEGLGGKKRSAELEKLLGTIPYLNGGMFDVHELEKKYHTDIEIPDAAFKRIFDYFDKYDWVLDPEHSVRQPGDKEEINPDVLGYIFEKYINQKQMGAYYTKEDITDYISKNTIIPFLFDAARKECTVAFENPSGPTVWDLPAKNPDRYIYAAVKKGAELPLPEKIALGLDAEKPDLVARRKLWNKPAYPEFALPTEIWREVVSRRSRCEEIRKKLAAGEIHDINDLITLNLDIRRFALDVIENCEGPDLLRAFWHAITTITVLDPTCGSGAFLFAALNILEPLYETCLARMTEFLNDETVKHDAAKLKFTAHGYPLLAGGKFEDFASTLEHVAKHVSPQYFIYKTIILQNLFGVDIMPEAVEICKLRLFLKLAAQVEPEAKKENLGIEPLPDVDFNICAGNTLVGYATLAEVQNSMFGRNYLERIQKADEQIRRFRIRQSQTGDLAEQREHKQQIRALLNEIREKLDLSLFTDYGARDLKAWEKSHQPFHWYVEFNSIIQSGGFDVIIGNPPWKEYSAVKKSYTVRGYTTEQSGNLYALCTERAVKMLSMRGFLSFIVQLPIVSSSRMETMRNFLARNSSFIAVITCDDRPGKLFDGLQHCRSTIFILQHQANSTPTQLWSSGYRRWATDVRDTLFPITSFAAVSGPHIQKGQFPKVASSLHVSAFSKLFIAGNRSLGLATSNRATKQFIFYQESAQYWLKATVGVPYYAKNQCVSAPAHGRHLFFTDERSANVAFTILNSSLFYIFYIAYGDCFHVSDSLATSFPVPPSALADNRLDLLATKLMRDLERNAERKTITTKDGDKISYAEFRVAESKPILDEIDRVLARHYRFTAEELDFIINYDIKYRLGRDTESE
jgi:hypothetical protein